MRSSAVVLLALLLVACGGRDPYDALPRPDPVEPLEDVATTIPGDLSSVTLPAARGTTTTMVAIGPGPITLLGRVEGPEGPVGGAIVRVERLVGDEAAVVEVPTAPDGTWNVENVLGGRYRIRAWRSPSLAMVRAQIFFVQAREQRPILLRLDRYEGRRIHAAVAPDPPPVDEPSNLKVRVGQRVVDERGIVRTTPQPGVTVRLTGSGKWFVMSPNPQTTGADGTVTFRVQCDEEGEQPLNVLLDDGEVVPLALPACVDASAPPTSSTTPSDSSTSSTSSTSPTTTTTEG